jgi:molybdate/tungstate transport system substrate-binding protein
MFAGWLALPRGSHADDSSVLHVALAGTIEHVIGREIGPVFTTGTGYKLDITRQSSVLLANRIASGELNPDVYIGSDANVMELVMGPDNNDRARWYLPILRSRTVLMYSARTRSSDDIEAVRAGKLPWYELIQRPGLVLGGRIQRSMPAGIARYSRLTWPNGSTSGPDSSNVSWGTTITKANTLIVTRIFH